MTRRVATRQDRELAAEDWLLSAVPDCARAREEWRQQGVTLIRYGTLFTALRMRAPLVHAVAGTGCRPEVAGFLTGVLSGGPVFVQPRGGYALISISAVQRWEERDTVCLGPETFIGVPATDRNKPNPALDSYWIIPIGRPGTLCAAGDISRLVATGPAAAARAVREDGDE